mgnify:CR=1 FL=1
MTPYFRPILALVAAFLTLWHSSSSAEATVNSIHHAMTVELEPASRTLKVSNIMTLKGSDDATFLLAPNFVITGLRVNGQPAPQSRHGDALKMSLRDDGEHRIDLQYTGRLPRLTDDGGGFDRAPQIASLDGSYLSASAAWHPLFQGVAASYQITLSLPESQKGVVPGKLIQETTEAGRYYAVFQSEVPSQGIVLIAGPFRVSERTHGDIVLRTYFPKGLEDLSGGYLDSTAGYIDQYAKLIGAYPFSAFNIVSGTLPVGLGFPGMTYIGERVLRLPFIRFTSLGHEVLHNWWGNGVEVDYESGNWAEGLTTYLADYAFAKKRNGDDGQRMRLEWLRDYAALPPRRDHAVNQFVSKRHDAAQIIGYNKVAFIFHMLERRLGTEQFAKAIQTFWLRHRFATAGWADLKQAFEDVSGRDLGVFFNQWLNRSGAPRLVVSDVQQASDRVSFTLTQPELPYALNVPIRLTTREGEKLYQASIDGKASRIELPLSAPAVSIAIDPDFGIFRRLDATEAPPILRDTTLNADTMVVFAGGSQGTESISKDLAERMLDASPRYATADLALEHPGPLLVIGETSRIQQFLHQARQPATPTSLAGKGTARAWATRRTDNKQPLLIVEANDAEALKALLRPLPHYGRRGYLVFNGSKATSDGVWPSQAGPLTILFDK